MNQKKKISSKKIQQFKNHLVKEYISELRQNPSSKDWVAIASRRVKKPEELIIKNQKRIVVPKKNCPFENLQKSGNKSPVLIKYLPNKKNWFLQIFENKYPAFQPNHNFITEKKVGPYKVIGGYGYHELLVLKDHYKLLADYSSKELAIILEALQERYCQIAQDKKIQYISIFHNWGNLAGATVYHPHLQIIAIPVIPSRLKHSLISSYNYWRKNHSCVHCEINNFELKEKKRILIKEKNVMAFSPFISVEPFAIRIIPIKHISHFEETPKEIINSIAIVLEKTLKILKKKLNNPDFNLFIHTAPTVEENKYNCYHWHIEIIPKISISAGFELSTGIEITVIDPNEAIKFLKS